MTTLSQIYDRLYSFETALWRDELAAHEAVQEISGIRQDLETYVTSAAHATPRDGTVLPGGSVWCLDFCVDYEGSSTVRCFAGENDARAMLAAIESYPPEPEFPDPATEDDEVWVRYDRDKASWIENHPLGPDHSWGGYYVVRELKVLPLEPAALTPPATRDEIRS